MGSRFSRLLVLSALSLVGLVGCQAFQSTSEKVVDPTRLESLTPADIDPEVHFFERAEEPELEHVIDSYAELLPLLKDPDEQIKVLHRLADLKLAKGEELMAEQAINELDIAVKAYNGLLQRYPTRSVNDRVHYQLAKTYDLQGNSEAYLSSLTTLVAEYPDSEYISEVHFRRGEILFSWGDYESSESAFEAVIAQGQGPFLANAHYMKGWSEFKQVRYKEALHSFVDVLDLLIPDGERTEGASLQSQTMINDLYRVMGLSFSYLGGADALETLFTETGPRAYEIDVYDKYSDLLVEKEQYTDAIEVYKRFITLHPHSLDAPRYQSNIINTLSKAGFITSIVEEKVRYVDTYGIGSAFWAHNKGYDLDFVFDELKVLLPELANRHYVMATNTKSKASDVVRQDHYAKAAGYYQTYLDTFPYADDVPDIRVLLAECHVALKHWPEAIFSFETAGYGFPGFAGSAESAYSSIVAYVEYAKQWKELDPDLRRINTDMQQTSRLRFVDRYPEDPRAEEVLYVSLRYAFNQRDYNQSIALANRSLNWMPQPDPTLLIEASVILAHSFYAIESYAQAEKAYVRAIAVMKRTDQRYVALQENLAAAVYQQAEAKLEQGDILSAITQLLRVGLVSPSASLRSNAEYDAIGYMIELKLWGRAIDEISRFRSRYPQHELIDTLVPKMALSYRETEQWEKAADEIATMAALAKTDEERRDNLFISAELYDRAENTQQAIVSYRRYANTYPEPADVYMEAANRLAELYELSDQPDKRRFWLNKQMQRVDSLGTDADGRMVYLAAAASAVLANEAFKAYAGIELKLPLNESMIKKTDALEKAMKAFQKTASYGISSFSTEAGYRMADIYAELSRDLMDSDRPTGLNELELEQYEILLEEQAFPFEDSAIEIHEQNASRSWNGIYDEWVRNSFNSLKTLLPGRYDKMESFGELINELP